ncbi:ATP-binding protein [bacterium]|nr:ATP-binding protein [bacterium]
MTDIFFKKIVLENYKCFQSQSIELNCPDGNTLGSGLNILIGENGTGKTSILEAVNFLTQSRYSSENKLTINDYYDYGKTIKILGHTKEFKCKSSIDFNNTQNNKLHFKASGIVFEAKSRDRKEANKLLSSPLMIKNRFYVNDRKYYKGSKQKGDIDSRDISFSDSRIQEGGIDVFYFDKNRSRHLVSGIYKTTFDRVCEDLNWKFFKNLNEENIEKILQSITGEYFSNTINISQKDIGKKLAKEMVQFFKNDLFKDLKIDLVDILRPFSNASIVIRADEGLKQINTKNLGSGIEIIMTLLLLKSLSGGAKNNSVIYLIDEPELHLHPKAQESLAKILLEESKEKQIIISTHSPYMFKELLPHSGLITLQNKESKILIQKEDSAQKPRLLPWSPSWGEINFIAYGMPTVEFHNELYGYLCEITNNNQIKSFETFLKNRAVKQNKTWIKIKDNNEEINEPVTLHTYIRNSIHHPENRKNLEYSDKELKNSIEGMIEILKQIKEEKLNG